MDNTKELICSVIAEKTVLKEHVYELDEEANLFLTGLDSFQLMNVIVELERRLEINFKDEELIVIRFQNLKEIYESICEVLVRYGYGKTEVKA